MMRLEAGNMTSDPCTTAAAPRAPGSIVARVIGLPARLRRVTTSSSYVPQIDGLRFLAIMPVLLWHATIRGHRFGLSNAGLVPTGEPHWMPVGEIGVELFFFISGYIIAFPFITAAARGRRFGIGNFYRRRLTRLEPPYILVLLICLALVTLSGDAAGHNPGRDMGPAVSPVTSTLASMVCLHAPLLHTPPVINPPTWSLEVEVQFYLLAPLLLGGYLAIRDRVSRRLVGVVAVLVAMAAAQLVPFFRGRWDWTDYTLAAHAWGFFLGVLVSDIYADVRARGEPAPSRRMDGVFLAGLVAFVASGFFQTYQELVTGFACNLVRAGAFAALFWGALQGTASRRVTGAPWIALIGGACYSIYLTHVPLMVGGARVLYALMPFPGYCLPVVIAALVLVPASIAVGLIYYAWIERPCMEPDWPARLWARLRRAETRA